MHPVRRRLISFATACAAAAALVAGLAGAAPPDASAHPGQSTASEPPPTPSGVTTINGKKLPGHVAPMKGTILLDAPDGNGDRTIIVRGLRAAGTRSPIHVHRFGGSTCVVSGEITLYLEGAKPRVAKGGECYYMPSGHVMAAYNSGRGTAVIFDYFKTPVGVRPFQPVEAGHEGYRPELDMGQAPPKRASPKSAH